MTERRERADAAPRADSCGAPPEARLRRLASEPAKLAEWWGAGRVHVTEHRARAYGLGGRYRIAMQPPEGELFHLRGEFLEVDAPATPRVHVRVGGARPRRPGDVVTLTFSGPASATELIFEQGPFATEARHEVHETGWTDTLDRLEHHARTRKTLELAHALREHRRSSRSAAIVFRSRGARVASRPGPRNTSAIASKSARRETGSLLSDRDLAHLARRSDPTSPPRSPAGARPSRRARARRREGPRERASRTPFASAASSACTSNAESCPCRRRPCSSSPRRPHRLGPPTTIMSTPSKGSAATSAARAPER